MTCPDLKCLLMNCVVFTLRSGIIVYWTWLRTQWSGWFTPNTRRSLYSYAPRARTPSKRCVTTSPATRAKHIASCSNRPSDLRNTTATCSRVRRSLRCVIRLEIDCVILSDRHNCVHFASLSRDSTLTETTNMQNYTNLRTASGRNPPAFLHTPPTAAPRLSTNPGGLITCHILLITYFTYYILHVVYPL